MNGSRAGIRYAKAILSFALEQQKEVEVYDDLMLVANSIDDSKELQLLLKNPILKSEIKKTALKELFSNKISKLAYKLIDLLVQNKRLPILSEVTKQYRIIYDELKGIEVAKVTTAIPLTEELNQQILKKVIEITGKQATVESIINPDIIGGFILRIGDIQYDASMSNKLQLLKREFESESFSL